MDDVRRLVLDKSRELEITLKDMSESVGKTPAFLDDPRYPARGSRPVSARGGTHSQGTEAKHPSMTQRFLGFSDTLRVVCVKARCVAGGPQTWPRRTTFDSALGTVWTNRNVPSAGLLKVMEYYTKSSLVLQTVTAVAVVALLMYVLFGPTL